jgi:hypothetical protein
MGTGSHVLFHRDHPSSGTNRAYHAPMNMDSRAPAIGAGGDGTANTHLTASPANLAKGVFREESKRICSGSSTKSTVHHDVSFNVHVLPLVHCASSILPPGESGRIGIEVENRHCTFVSDPGLRHLFAVGLPLNSEIG